MHGTVSQHFVWEGQSVFCMGGSVSILHGRVSQHFVMEGQSAFCMGGSVSILYGRVSQHFVMEGQSAFCMGGSVSIFRRQKLPLHPVLVAYCPHCTDDGSNITSITAPHPPVY